MHHDWPDTFQGKVDFISHCPPIGPAVVSATDPRQSILNLRGLLIATAPLVIKGRLQFTHSKRVWNCGARWPAMGIPDSGNDMDLWGGRHRRLRMALCYPVGRVSSSPFHSLLYLILTGLYARLSRLHIVYANKRARTTILHSWLSWVDMSRRIWLHTCRPYQKQKGRQEFGLFRVDVAGKTYRMYGTEQRRWMPMVSQINLSDIVTDLIAFAGHGYVPSESGHRRYGILGSDPNSFRGSFDTVNEHFGNLSIVGHRSSSTDDGSSPWRPSTEDLLIFPGYLPINPWSPLLPPQSRLARSNRRQS